MNRCPNCHLPLRVSQQTLCPYCRARLRPPGLGPFALAAITLALTLAGTGLIYFVLS